MHIRQTIINELAVSPTINPVDEIKRRANFLAEYLKNSHQKGFVLGISGGQDSLLAGIITQKAINILKKRGLQVSFHALLLPCGSQTDRNDAELAIKTIAPDVVHDINIRHATDAFTDTYNTSTLELLSDFNKGNVKARMRMIAHYAIAGQHQLLVVGTDHAAEAVMGFFTKYGDGGADILPLAGLTKRQGRALLTHLNVPSIFTTKAPTADLLDNNPNQPDEQELALSYDTIDDYLENKPIDSHCRSAIEQRYHATKHKRALPIAYGADTL